MTNRAKNKPEISLKQTRFRLYCALTGVVALAIGFGPSLFTQFVEDRAQQNLKWGRPRTALQWLERAGGESSGRPSTLFLLARTWRKLDEYERAMLLLDQAQRRGHHEEQIQRERWLVQAQSGQLSEAERHLSQLLRNPQGDGAEICEAFVQGYRTGKRFHRCKAIIDAWETDFPFDAGPHYWRGRIWQDTNFNDLAESEYRRALEFRPDERRSLLALAQILQRRLALDEAFNTYQRVLELDPKDITAELGAVTCLRQLGRAREAEERVRGFGSDAATHEILFERGALAFALGKYDEAINVLSVAHKQAPHHGGIRQQLAMALAGAGRVAESQPHFAFLEKAHRYQSQIQELSARVFADPRDAQARVELARLLLKMGSDEDALRWLYGALEISPRFASAHQTLMEYYESHQSTQPDYADLARRHRSMWEASREP